MDSYFHGPTAIHDVLPVVLALFIVPIENAVVLSQPIPIGVFPILALNVVKIAGTTVKGFGKVIRLFVAVTGPLRDKNPNIFAAH